jgi:hypothetical protein
MKGIALFVMVFFISFNEIKAQVFLEINGKKLLILDPRDTSINELVEIPCLIDGISIDLGKTNFTVMYEDFLNKIFGVEMRVGENCFYYKTGEGWKRWVNNETGYQKIPHRKIAYCSD